MNSCCFQRARSPEQKAERRAQILQAAEDAFESDRFQAVALVDIARQAGVTKAALYRYFPSKEALFLALYLSELEALADIELQGGKPLWEQMADVLIQQRLFCRLTAILHSVLEQNLDVQQARDFKQTLLKHFAVLSGRLQQHYSLPADKVNKYLMQVQQSIIGCWIVSNPAPVIDHLLTEPPLSIFRVEFAEALRQQLKALESAL
ncbi:TetR family transcriptional regulator [Alcanivorax sediminis]|uniref:TetR family transcriptional regulator n=1 Tax=Alcanivorax sediminis TaxID=2663008 RepID=A0A6N7LTH9_9GAMM|nr:TetR family transcriptional regulator [Alcanivorax sediminis]MQX53643.1 TetR family transcriptional regulator [Alcanivorax sediminis]